MFIITYTEPICVWSRTPLKEKYMGRPLNIRRLAGNITEGGKQLAVRAKITTNHRSASLIQQKNSTSFKVLDSSGQSGVCTLVNKANNDLLAGEMTLSVTPAVGPVFRAARITNKFVWDFSGNRHRWSFNPVSGKVLVGSEYDAPDAGDVAQTPPVVEPTPTPDYEAPVAPPV